LDNLARREVVSSEAERLILVDENDQQLGFDSKGSCHDGEGQLHRAFSLFIFNSANELLLQKRSARKRLWPDFWSNSCCSHPREGESMAVATARRLKQELGLGCPLQYLYKFQYHARFRDLGSERELCWVYIGRSDDPVHTNVNEISDWRFVKPDDLNDEIRHHADRFTPWFKMEWDRIQNQFGEQLAAV
jgi:isopentenyl-diphosphate delta-isomerase